MGLVLGTLMQPTKLDYCIESFGRRRRYTVSLPLPGRSLSPQGFQKQASCCLTFLLTPMRAWRGVHRKAYCPALDSIAVAGSCPRT